ncbi:SecDF P1 head subdomain-containing protein [Paralcaligenes ureilyticus]|uniref:SecDF P1 head subdomain domain-containing protein n=1 Tax=Paralcaligenes ureilyticus TaxID=627131 RepID=A0A4R3LU57_9BURK|nr:hypothetical protein [Paralcaligenes ureilyticus]TCT04063.1 hypothetical protein EDC26_11341 [Paralcaligenes ureilyticus]
MKIVRLLGRIIVPGSLILLAACQSVPGKKNTAAISPPEQAATPQATPEAVPQPTPAPQAATQGAPVAVFLADTQVQAGWTAVKISEGTLYVNPRPVITRTDLASVRAGADKQGTGLLALDLNSTGKQKITDITTQNPNKRLALVVGRTMMAAPGYSKPITASQLVFVVGTEQNAMAAAQAIAGSGSKPAAAPDATSLAPSAPSSATPVR